MKALVITFLAALALSGCGVGADEVYDGTTLTTSQDALLQNNNAIPQLDSSANSTGYNGKDPGSVGLPQDPIPLRDGKGGTAVSNPAVFLNGLNARGNLTVR